MSRTSKLDERKQKPQDRPETLIATILEDAIKTATMSFSEWHSQNKFPIVHLAIPVLPDGEYRVTQSGIDAAHKLTSQAWHANEEYRQTISRPEFEKLSFRAIGETIKNARSFLPPATENDPPETVSDLFLSRLSTEYLASLSRLAKNARHDVDRHIPCHLFHSDQNVPTFHIGPVAFRPRAEWIQLFIKDPLTRNLVKSVESGAMQTEELYKQAREQPDAREFYNASSALRAIGDFSWIATIRLPGHELSLSHRKASTIVGLAIDALGSRFQLEDATRFTKAGRQHLFSEDRLATFIDGSLVRGMSTQMPGLGSKPGALAAKMKAERQFLDAAGTLLDVYVQARQTGRAPHLVERWANALFWIGEARREGSDFMAVVDYGCAADGISGAGGDAAAMTRFAEAALNPKNEPTPANSISISDAVTVVYREGRNKIAHGETSGLLEDLERPRAIGDALLVNLLDAVTMELAEVVQHRPKIFEIDEKNAYRALEARLRSRTPTPS